MWPRGIGSEDSPKPLPQTAVLILNLRGMSELEFRFSADNSVDHGYHLCTVSRGEEMTSEIERTAQYSIDYLESFLSPVGRGVGTSDSLPFEIESESGQRAAFETIRKHFEIHHPWLSLRLAEKGRFGFSGIRP